MTGRTQTTPRVALPPRRTADQHTGASPPAVPASTLESDMHLIPEQMARSHLEPRQRRPSDGASGASPSPSVVRKRPSVVLDWHVRRPSWPRARPPLAAR